MADHYSPTDAADAHPPLNSAPSLAALCADYLTDEANFFNRNHGSIPRIEDADDFTIAITGSVRRERHLSLRALRAEFAQREIIATLACAGNRRQEFDALSPIMDEIIWNEAAVGNAVWQGVLLRDILASCGITDAPGQHVAFEGLDRVALSDGEQVFGASVALEKVLSSDVLLATGMNGAPLTPARGFPVRVIVPGYIGARSVKWVHRITVQPHPSTNYYQQRAYRMFPRHISKASADWDAGVMLTDQVVNAIICSPADGARLSERRVTVRGFALPQGDHAVARVEVSTDDGQSWSEARITSPTHRHTWCLWEHPCTLAGEHTDFTLVARAFDTGGNAQPARADAIWNFKGYMNNAWHRVRITAPAS